MNGATAEQVREVFDQATGTSQYHRLTRSDGILCTDSIYLLSEMTGSYWLVDLIASYNDVKFRNKHSFQVWTLKVDDNKKAVVTCKEDIGAPVVVSQKIEYTDFPRGEWKFYCQRGTPEYHVLMSPGDH